jgi:hypothetical protein
MNLTQLIAASLVGALTFKNDVVKAAVLKRQEEAEKRAIDAVGKHLETMEVAIKERAQQLRDTRKRARMQKKSLDLVVRAAAYFGETGNPLPFLRSSSRLGAIVEFCNSVGIPVPKDDSPAYKVPDDFKMPEVQAITDKIDDEVDDE